MKKFELLFTALQLPLDYIMIVLAGLTAYSLRFSDIAKDIRPVKFNLPWEHFGPLLFAVALGWVIIFAFAGLYHSNPNRKLAKDLSRVVFACSTGFAAITFYVFFTLQRFDSRFLVLAGWILAIIYVCAGRIFIRLLKNLFYRLGIGLRRTIIIGRESIASQIKKTLETTLVLGHRLVGTFEHFDENAEKIILSKKTDEIIFTDPKADEEQTLHAVDFANEHHITFKYSADLFDTISTNMAISTISGIPIIELGPTKLTGWGRIFKRIFDFIFGIVFLIIALPFMAIITLIILFETGRPVIYKNERVGQNGKKFFVYKFRSMYQKDCTGNQFGKGGNIALAKEEELIKTNSIKNGPIYKIVNDPRVTSFGKFIRRWSLDELPQLINVISGDMSLVGPRPHQPREVDKYQRQHKIVHSIKPGVSGLAQISGRSGLTYEEEINLDTFYMEHWTLLMDLVIILKTPFVVLKRRGAL